MNPHLLFVCVCVCERERVNERERARERARKREREYHLYCYSIIFDIQPCPVFVCVWERLRERERVPSMLLALQRYQANREKQTERERKRENVQSLQLALLWEREQKYSLCNWKGTDFAIGIGVALYRKNIEPHQLLMCLCVCERGRYCEKLCTFFGAPAILSHTYWLHNILCGATHRNTLQHTATPCNTHDKLVTVFGAPAIWNHTLQYVC